MIVYANEFYFESNGDGLDRVKDAIKRWLGRKLDPEFRPIRIIPFAKPFKVVRPDTDTNEVMIIGTPDLAEDYCLSVTYRHNDRQVDGRAWFTRIGIERGKPGEPLRVTILLETQEVSPQAALHPVTPSQPGVVQELLKRCGLHQATPGAAVRDLTPANVDDFKREVEIPHRPYAVVVVSVDDFSEKPLVDPVLLQRRLVGLAQVYSIPTKRDARKLREGILPPYHTAWDGTVTVISPDRANFLGPRGKVYRGEQIEALREDTGAEFDVHLFAELTHSFNLAKSRRHIGDSVVGRRLTAYKLAQLRERAADTSEFQELVESYERDRDEAKKYAQELEAKLLEAEIQNEKLRDDIHDLEKRIRSLEYQLHQARNSAQAAGGPVAPLPVTAPGSLEEVPDWLDREHPNRVVFAGRAVRTLKASSYEDLEKAGAIFRVLATSFFAAFRKEIKFEDAIKDLEPIPARYSGTQSEVTAGMSDGYECTHNGVKYSLMKHIGLGTSRDPRYCFRLYFEWDDKAQRIIVLHAGRHLDTQST
jgi:hypothetical protein